MSNIAQTYEFVMRGKLRFPSPRGDLTAEQLWDVPLRSQDGFDLDNMARATNRKLKEVTEESFVTTSQKPNATALRLEGTLDMLKHVISVKLDEENQAREKAEQRKELELLTRIYAEKKEERLSESSEKDLQKRIKALKDSLEG